VIRLALLLLGTEAMRRRWRRIMLMGAVWIAIGAAIMFDVADGVTVVATETFAVLLLAEGGLRLAATAAHEDRRRWLDLVDGALLVGCALLILDWPINTDAHNGMLFAAALLADGLVRAASGHIVRFRGWRLSLAAGLGEVALAIVLLVGWPLPYRMGVPVTLAFVLILSGASAVRVALFLRGLPAGATVAALPFFRRPGRGAFPAAVPAARAATLDHPAGGGEVPFTIYVWTARGSAEDPRRVPLADRYIAAIGRQGRVSTGHAACGLAPDIYISHYRAEELDVGADGFAAILDAGQHNDVPGRFLPSYEEEAAGWMEATARVEVRRYNAARLAAFWAVYRTDSTYNLTDRNCSVAVVMAMDAALEGVLGDGPFWRWLLGLLRNPDLWTAAVLRRRAEQMAWTPGLVLDYARALRRVVESRRAPSVTAFRAALRRFRSARPSEAA
jgi:uncharacterized membrane protein HdeD (DUF308 family)